MREWFIVGSKLLGIYFLNSALTTLPPSIGLALSSLSAGGRYYQEPSSLAIFLASAFSGLVMMASAYVLLFKTELIADKLKVSGVSHPSGRRGDNLQHGIALIGIYFFAAKIGGLAKVFVLSQRANKINDSFAATQPQGLTFSSNCVEPGVTLILSLLLVFGSKHIAAFLTKEKQTETF